MQPVDYSPTNAPSLAEQQDALQKGLGRTWGWASTKNLAEAPLLEACLVDMRFDQQCEDLRTDWLWSLIQKTGMTDLIRNQIFDAMSELADERSAQQLCQFGYRYAQLGDKPFRSRLYEIVETKPFDDKCWLGEQEIVDLDGEQAFLFAARIRGERLASKQWDWENGSLARIAIEKLQEDAVVSALQTSTDAAINRYYVTLTILRRATRVNVEQSNLGCVVRRSKPTANVRLLRSSISASLLLSSEAGLQSGKVASFRLLLNEPMCQMRQKLQHTSDSNRSPIATPKINSGRWSWQIE